jgi:hypothetical protein
VYISLSKLDFHTTHFNHVFWENFAVTLFNAVRFSRYSGHFLPTT